ncbi:MAG: folylpolyglutamate synthase/dihydrofolate synthase family protein [Deltaproteobacteria bacterium]|nr:folylpolyglutamate synthase/dihydrofolate synthase family protein [Deltaproteobacteria bacterium]
MNLKECLAEIEELQGRGIHRGLERMTAACHLLKNPQNIFPSVHIAGTNGKGSTAAMTVEILRRAGFKTGFTLSPHLESFRERIQINGEWIPGDELVALHQFVKKKAGHLPLTYFEWATLISFLAFAHARVDMAVIETGMGGRWDATNVILPLVGGITNVSLDHEEYLGKTAVEILDEKLQIFKPGMTAWAGIMDKPLLERAASFCAARKIPFYSLADYFRERGESFDLFSYRGLSSALAGRHQNRNAALAVALTISLREKGYGIPQNAVDEGLTKARWPGRLETLQTTPLVLIDGAHNRGGIAALVDFLKASGRRYHLVFGALKDRPFEEMLAPLLPFAASHRVAAFDAPRAFSMEELEIRGREILRIDAGSWKDYMESIPKDAAVLVTGSLYLVAQVRALIKGAKE